MTDKNTPAIADGKSLSKSYPPGTNWDIDIPQMDLTRLIDESIVRFSDQYAMNFLGRRITYKEFGTLVSKAAKGMQQMGVKKGDRVGLYMPNTPYYPIMFFAALRLGATAVNFSPLYTKEELRAQIRDSGTSVMVALDLKQFQKTAGELMNEGELRDIITCPLADMLPTLKGVAYRFLKSSEVAKPSDDPHNTRFGNLIDNDGIYNATFIDPQQTAVLQYTGGTTGTPKGAMLSHFNLVANALQIEEFYGANPNKPAAIGQIRPGDGRVMAAIPYFHVFGMMTSMIMALRMGQEIVIIPNPRDMKQALKAIEQGKPTMFPAVPRLLQALSEDKNAHKYDFTSIEVVMSGGAALPPGVKTAFEKAARRDGIIKQGYGLTETSPAATSNPASGANKIDSVGLAYPMTQIRIADPEDSDITLPMRDAEGKPVLGEILIKGPQVMKGYYNKPDETENVMTKDGWFKTGDLGFLDDDYYLHIVDRKKRMIIINGFKVFPTQVEKAISNHPAVAECVVLAVPDARSGEAAKVLIRLKAGEKLDDKELREYLDGKIHRIEMPKHVEFVKEEILKTAVGKPDWKKLQDIEKEKYNAANKEKPADPKP